MTATITYREAIRKALREVLQADPRAFLMGEDVGRYGGAFAVSKGLLEERGYHPIQARPFRRGQAFLQPESVEPVARQPDS